MIGEGLDCGGDNAHEDRGDQSGPETVNVEAGGDGVGEQEHRGVDDEGEKSEGHESDGQREHMHERLDGDVDEADDKDREYGIGPVQNFEAWQNGGDYKQGNEVYKKPFDHKNTSFT